MNPPILRAPKKGPARCSRFDSCNAPVCPLEPDWSRAQHLSGERVCGLLCELVKDGGEARLRARVPAALVNTLTEVLPRVSARWERIRRELDRASCSGSKLESGMWARERKIMRAAGDQRASATPEPDRACDHGTRAYVGPPIGITEANP